MSRMDDEEGVATGVVARDGVGTKDAEGRRSEDDESKLEESRRPTGTMLIMLLPSLYDVGAE